MNNLRYLYRGNQRRFLERLTMKVILICGPVGVGKTTYTLALSKELGAVRFSIDPWMQSLFAKDMTTLDFAWMMERVERCQRQIWEVCEQIIGLGGTVILDLGFTTKAQRSVFVELANKAGAQSEIHYLSAPTSVRKMRVEKRNSEKDPLLYSMEVTEQMFDFMEPLFEVPDDLELSSGRKIVTGT